MNARLFIRLLSRRKPAAVRNPLPRNLNGYQLRLSEDGVTSRLAPDVLVPRDLIDRPPYQTAQINRR